MKQMKRIGQIYPGFISAIARPSGISGFPRSSGTQNMNLHSLTRIQKITPALFSIKPYLI